jgi:cytochrome c biogenesis protein
MQQSRGLLHEVYHSFASLKLTIFIFLTLAVFSLVGTLMPQGLNDADVQSQFSPGVASWIRMLGLNDVYHTGWFRFLLLLLCVNLIICSIERLPKTVRLLRHREEHLDPQKLLKFSCSNRITTKLPMNEARERITRIVSESFAPLKTMDNPGAFSAFAEKGRWSPLMVYVTHASVLLIILGALIGSLWGFKGFMNIPTGDTSAMVQLYSGQRTVALPFQVRCDKFDVSFYDTGAPKEYRSDLTLLKQDNEILKRSIRVNDPLTYDGISIYQASYGSILKQAEAELKDQETGKTYNLTLPYGKPVPIPGTNEMVEAVSYQQDLSRFGPAVGMELLKEGGGDPEGAWILVKVPGFHGNRLGNYHVQVTGTELGQYTGLQVKKDPGVWLVYLGFIVMVLGVGMTFYSSHRRIWIIATPGKSSTQIVIAGRSNKNQYAFEHDFKNLTERLQRETK